MRQEEEVTGDFCPGHLCVKALCGQPPFPTQQPVAQELATYRLLLSVKVDVP